MADKANKSKKLVTIQGNIGSGKSTFVKQLKNLFKENKKIYFLQEPVDIWMTIKDKDGVDIITHYYKDQSKYAFAFQMMAYISRLSQLREALKQDYDIIISERSLETDKHVFAQMLYDSKKIDHISYQIYHKWFNEFKDELPKESVVYIKTDPEVAQHRIVKRARPGEEIPLEYLKSCHDYHESWLEKHVDKIILDGNIDTEEHPETINIWYEKIMKIINN